MRTVREIMPAHMQGVEGAEEARTASAYQALFDGNGSREDAEIVLTDLMMTSRWNEVLPEGADDAALQRHNGGRAVFGRVVYMMNVSGDVLAALEGASARALEEMEN